MIRADNPPLTQEMLERRLKLPAKPAPIAPSGSYVYLLPLVLERDLDTLYTMSNGNPIALGGRFFNSYNADELIWRYMSSGPFPSKDEMGRYLQNLIDAKDGLCLCVFDLATHCQVGVVNYIHNQPLHLRIELGSLWYSPIVQRTKANTEAAYMLLKHAFGLGYRRVEWKCNALNERSWRAALKIGFRFEAVQEYHMIVKDRNRDTAWFRLLDHEWDTVRKQLETMLYSTP